MDCTIVRTNGFHLTEGSFVFFPAKNKTLQGLIVEFLNETQVIVRGVDMELYRVYLSDLHPACK